MRAGEGHRGANRGRCAGDRVAVLVLQRAVVRPGLPWPGLSRRDTAAQQSPKTGFQLPALPWALAGLGTLTRRTSARRMGIFRMAVFCKLWTF